MEYQKQFIQIVKLMAKADSELQVFSDFTKVMAANIATAIPPVPSIISSINHEEIMNRYGSKPENNFAQLQALVFEAFQYEKAQDFLGSVYMNLNAGRENRGQFFTPYNLAEATVRSSLPSVKKVIKEKGYVVLSEPCLGAGAMMIAAASELQRQGIDHTRCVWFEGQDIDRMAAFCGYIQTSVIGLSGRVIIADTLSYPSGQGISIDESKSNILYTPMAHQSCWETRFAKLKVR